MDKQEQKEIISRVCELLRRVHKWKWRNTGALAKELRLDEGILLKVLSQHAAKPDRKIRYHPLPSGRRMDVLWGLVEAVGETEKLPALRRADVPEGAVEELPDPTMPFVFLSHNHRDAPTIIRIERDLREAGVGTWLFETGIDFDSNVIPAVRRALERCSGILLFLSEDSLSSIWVRKEFGFSLAHLGRPALVLIDGNIPELLNCFTGRNSPLPGVGAIQSYVAGLPAPDETVRKERVWNAREIAHQLGDYLDHGGSLVVYPSPTGAVGLKEDVFGDRMTLKAWASEIAGGEGDQQTLRTTPPGEATS